MLKPQASATRELVSLDGLWNFEVIKTELDQQQPWAQPLQSGLEAPVPASYNDLFVADPTIRSHVGWVAYQRSVFVPRGWTDQRYYIRVEAATHQGRVYVNDKFLVEHIGGYTPFDAEITDFVKPGQEFQLTIAVNNELSNTTIPPGRIEVAENGTRRQKYDHDFFNYAGLARSVWIYSKPKAHIEDITVVTDKRGATGVVKYTIKPSATSSNEQIKIQIVDKQGKVVAHAEGLSGEIEVPEVQLWQPGAAYLYQLAATLVQQDANVVDSYNLPIGIRSVQVRGHEFFINDRPFYFTGFGKHEDTLVRGKGHDPAYLVHDFELMKWIGANSFRTSHYPYAEEVMEYADRHGFVVIDETPAVGLNKAISSGLFGGIKIPSWDQEHSNDQTRESHAQAIRELFARDKNHPSVVMWCLSNEPASSEQGAREYFIPLCEMARQLDPSRPICFANVMFAPYQDDLISDLFDVLLLNRYYGWYVEQGDLAMAEVKLERELLGWEKMYGKPMIMAEYGADTLAGLHEVRDTPWSEEYQANYYDMYHRVHDRVKSLAGEQVWNFADFMTSIKIFRADGNHKGIFTRDRKPKAAAHTLRKRWTVIRSQGNGKPVAQQVRAP
jgi:beta-glucuronidase